MAAEAPISGEGGPRGWLRAETVAAATLLLSWLLVWPVGEYAIEDDWAFVRSLQILHDEGRFAILDWNPMSLVGHLVWGLAFTKLFGFGFTVAKLSTLVLALVACLALAALLRGLGVRERAVTLVVLAFLFSPILFFQSFLYATDVPTTAWTVLALLGYLRGLASLPERGRLALLVGSACAAIGWLVRQPAIFTVVAVLAYLVLFDRSRLRDARSLAAAFLLPVLAVAGFEAWYLGVHGPTAAYEQALGDVGATLRELTPGAALVSAWILLSYVGLFLLPVLAGLGGDGWRGAGRRGAFWGLFAAALLVAVWLWQAFGEGRAFPYVRNKLTPHGFLPEGAVFTGLRPVLWPPGTGFALGLLFTAAAAAFVARWPRGLAPPAAGDVARERRTALRLASLLFALHAAYLMAGFLAVFDRHLLALFVPALVVVCALEGPRLALRPLPYALALVPLALYAVAGTHDVHAFSRAAFRAGEELLARGVPAHAIDAGYAFDGWHMYERSREELAAGEPPRARAGDPWFVQAIAPRILTRYVVSLSHPRELLPRPGAPPPPYRALVSRGYRAWLPPRRDRVWILWDRRLGGAPVPLD